MATTISISIASRVNERIIEVMKKKGITNKSEFIEELIRNSLIDEEVS